MKVRLPTLKHDFITMETHDEERMYEYEPLTRFILRSFKFIYTDIDELVGALLTSVDDMQGNVADEEMQAYIELFLFYYSQANKQITEEMLIEKVRESDEKGAKLLTILEARERKGIEETKRKLAVNMLKDGLPVDLVVKYATLSVEKVEELREKLD